MIEKPRIRAVEAFPITQDGDTVICLRDPTGLAPDAIAIGMGAYFLVTLFDGTNDLRDLHSAFVKRFGERLPDERLIELIEALDRAYFLDSPALKRRASEIREEFLRRPDRPAIHAGLCYAPQAGAARVEIESFFASPEGPGTTQPPKKGGSLGGLIAPHIDPRRGAAAYAHAYAELRAHQPPELVIILGTSHYGAGPELFSATRKDYATPFGAARTDSGFLERLAEGYRGDLFADEILHRNEHSIEFQALFLKWALEGHQFSIAPILVTSFHEMIVRGATPRDDRRVGSFLDAMSRELARERRRVLILCGVDFAHVGRKFGDEFTVDEKMAGRVQQSDMGLIEHIRRGDARGFFSDVARDRDARRICGFAPMYTQLELLSGRSGRLLKYGIAMEPDTGSAVSFASLAID